MNGAADMLRTLDPQVRRRWQELKDLIEASGSRITKDEARLSVNGRKVMPVPLTTLDRKSAESVY